MSFSKTADMLVALMHTWVSSGRTSTGEAVTCTSSLAICRPLKFIWLSEKSVPSSSPSMGGMAIVGRYSSKKLSTASLVVDMSRSRAASSTVALSASSTTLDMSTFATPLTSAAPISLETEIVCRAMWAAPLSASTGPSATLNTPYISAASFSMWATVSSELRISPNKAVWSGRTSFISELCIPRSSPYTSSPGSSTKKVESTSCATFGR
mmetsp:Transcript_46947/g.106310  ORF Transcript_46947/g.106310 Transcript_46947/m.106310 type:complete len:210 (+) Transcript_46947:827-1456(+)